MVLDDDDDDDDDEGLVTFIFIIYPSDETPLTSLNVLVLCPCKV